VHNFPELPDEKGDDNIVKSEFYCFGHDWEFQFYPGGADDAEDGDASTYLSKCPNDKVTIDYRFLLLELDGELSSRYGWGEGTTLDKYSGNSVGWDIEREKLLTRSYLNNGTLTFRVDMRLSAKEYPTCILKQPCSIDNTEVYLDDETSDVAFHVKGKVFVAHKGILKAQAREFYEMCEDNDKENLMVISDVDEDIFRIMLYSLYGGGLRPDDLQEHSASILKASSKYGFTKLKEEAEIWHAKSIKFTVDNAVDEFMKADGSNYPIIKDAAKKFILKHGKEIVASESFARLHESLPLMREVLAASFENNSNKRQRVG
jgi:hypothetical protein